MTGAILWQDCILCQCWHTVGQPHLTKGQIAKVNELGTWWSSKGVPYLSRDKVRESIANDVFEKVEREWGKRMNLKRS